jgi:hypothetical protein
MPLSVIPGSTVDGSDHGHGVVPVQVHDHGVDHDHVVATESALESSQLRLSRAGVLSAGKTSGR